MVSVSNEFKNAYKAKTRDIVARVQLAGRGSGDGLTHVFTLTPEDIIDISVEYPFSSETFPSCGNVYCSTLTMTILANRPNSSFWTTYPDIRVRVYLVLQTGTPPTDETCDLGWFYVRRRTSNDNYKTFTIEGQDLASLLDVPLPSTWNTGASTGSINPWTYYADKVVGNILSACGSLIDPNFTFPTDSQGNRLTILSLNGNWMPENITARQALGYIGGLFGANGMMTRDGYFTYKQYTLCPNAIDSVPFSMQYLNGLVRDREDPQYQYGGFFHAGDGITNPTGFTPDDFNGAVYLNSDPVLRDWGSALSPTWTEATDTFVYYSNQFATDFSGEYFVGGELQYRGMPWLECGDVVYVDYEHNGTTYSNCFMISHHTLKITGGLSGTMRCYTPLIAEVEDADSSSGTFGSAVTGSVNLGKSHPVGSVFVTNDNTNPVDILKFGTWTLIDKEFKSQSRTATVSRNTTNFSALSVTAIYEGHNITFIGSMTSSVSMGETNLEVLTQTLSDNGASSLPQTIPFVGYTDGGNAVIMIDIDTAGRVRTLDVVVRGTGTSVASGNSFDWSVTCPCLYTAMQDSFCDKFYWERTA